MNQSRPRAAWSSSGAGWPSLCRFFCFFIILLFTLKPIAPKGIYGIYSTVGYALTALMFALCFFRAVFSKLNRKRAELILLAVYVFWLFLSRVLLFFTNYAQNRSVSELFSALLHTSLDLTLVLDLSACLCVFDAAAQLDRERRRSLVRAVAVLCAVYAFAVSAVGLFVTLTGTCLSLPPEFACFFVESGQLTLLSNNWNISMVWVYLGFCMSAYLFSRSKRAVWRVLLAAAMLLEFVVICIGSSRTVQFVLYMSVAMLAMLAVLRALRGRRALLVVPAVCAAAVVGLGLSFFSCGKIQGLITVAANKTVPAFASYYHALERRPNPNYFRIAADRLSAEAAAQSAPPLYSALNLQAVAAPAAAADAPSFVDGRDLLADMKTFTERKFIWMSAVDSIKERPSILLTGSTRGDLMTLPNKYARSLYGIQRDHEHMHNFLIQTLMLSGLPGLLPAAAFCLLLVIRMVRLFFSGGVAGSVKVLLIPPAGLLVQGLFEAGLFTSIEMRGVYFFFLAGVIVAESLEAVRSGKNEEKS